MVPDVKMDSRINWSYWPHGFVYFQNPDYSGFRYALKYALKEQDGLGHSKALAMSKKPPLGHQFFMELADDLVERRLPVQSPDYAFANVVTRAGKVRRFWLQGRMREMFLDRYQIMWRLLHNSEPPWSDFYVSGYLDKIEAARRGIDPAAFARHVEEMRPLRVRIEPDPEGESDVSGSTRFLFFDPRNRANVAVAYPRGVMVTYKAVDTWIVGTESVATQLGKLGLPPWRVTPVCQWIGAA